MNTKYILHGGRAKDPTPDNDIFFQEILRDTPQNAHVLVVLFASLPEKDSENMIKIEAQFERNKNGKNVSYELAKHEDFAEQAKRADAIYLSGGTTPKLLEGLENISEIKKLFEGKIVAGESAGANVLSSYSYSKSAKGILKGLGLVPVKTCPHYDGTYPQELDALPNDLELLLLKEQEFKVFYI